MGKTIRPTISLASLVPMMTLDGVPQRRALTEAQEAEFGEIVNWLRSLTESPYRGAVTLHLNGQGHVSKDIELRAKILLDGAGRNTVE